MHRALPARRHDASLRLDDRDFRQQRQDNRAHYRGGQFHSALMRIFLSILSACGMTLRSVPPTQKRGSMGGGSDNNDDNAGGRSIGRAIGIAIPAVIGPPGRWAGDRPLGDPQLQPSLSTTQVAVILCETSNPAKQVIDEPPKVRITGQPCPDRGTIDRSNTDRDYRMSTSSHWPRICDFRAGLAQQRAS